MRTFASIVAKCCVVAMGSISLANEVKANFASGNIIRSKRNGSYNGCAIVKFDNIANLRSASKRYFKSNISLVGFVICRG